MKLLSRRLSNQQIRGTILQNRSIQTQLPAPFERTAFIAAQSRHGHRRARIADLPGRSRPMLNLQRRKIRTSARNQVVAARLEFQHHQIGGRLHVHRLLEQSCRVVEQPRQVPAHIKLIGAETADSTVCERGAVKSHIGILKVRMSDQETPVSQEPKMPVPPATFEFLVASFRFQAEMQLGLLKFGQEEKEDEKSEPDLDGARHFIDLLGMLQEKTRGNLSLEEQRLLENSLTELRFRFVQAAEQSKTK